MITLIKEPKKVNVRPALNWWNTLDYPDRSKYRLLSYPDQESVHVSDKQKHEMYLKHGITV